LKYTEQSKNDRVLKDWWRNFRGFCEALAAPH